MLELTAPYAAAAAAWLLTYALHSTVLIGAVWVLCGVLDDMAPETRDVLWRVALLAGVVTATAAAAVREDHLAAAAVVATVEERAVRWEQGAPAPVGYTIRAQLAAPSAECRAALRRGRIEDPGWLQGVRSACGPVGSFAWYHGVFFLWLGCSLVGVARLVREHRDLAALSAGFVPAGPRSRAALARVLPAGVGTPDIRLAAGLDAPCVVDRRTIVLPERCERDLSDGELEAVLAHEVAHVRRGDVLWLRAGRLLQALLWVQPLNRIALRGMTAAAELVCDDWALRRTGEPLGLARSISRVAEWALPGADRRRAVVAMAGADGRTLSARVRRILGSSCPREAPPRWRRLLLAAAVCAPVFLLPAVPGPPVRQAAIFVGEGPHTIAPGERAGIEGAAVEQRVMIRLTRS